MKQYILKLPPEKERNMRIIYAAISLCPTVFYLAAGLLDADMGRMFYTALPFAIMFLPLVFLPASALPVVIGKTSFSEKQYGKIVTRGKICGWISTVLSVWCAAGTLYFCITHPDSAAAQIPFGLGCVITSVAAIVFVRFHKSISTYVSPVDNSNLE